MVRKEKLGAKNIEFGSVKVARPGRNCGAEDVLLVENVFYVKERYYNNKVAKIRKKLLLWPQQLIRMTCLAVLMVIAGNCGMREVL
jgi:hypothetical protein